MRGVRHGDEAHCQGRRLEDRGVCHYALANAGASAREGSRLSAGHTKLPAITLDARAPDRKPGGAGEGKKVGRTTSPRAAEISRAIAILVIAATPALAFVSYFTRGH
jgi:hypothetical protein